MVYLSRHWQSMPLCGGCHFIKTPRLCTDMHILCFTLVFLCIFYSSHCKVFVILLQDVKEPHRMAVVTWNAGRCQVIDYQYQFIQFSEFSD